MREIRVGYSPITQPIFDKRWAEEMHQRSLSLLRGVSGIRLIEGNGTIMTEKEAWDAARAFQKGKVDVVLMQSVNSDGGILASILGQNSGAPVLLWSTPEPTLHDTGLRANSFCGAMIIAATLRRLHIRYKHLEGFPDDARFRERLTRSIRVLGCIAALRESKLGLIGYQTPGFHHVSFDEILLRRTFGVGVQHVDLSEVFSAAQSISKDSVMRTVEEIKREGVAGKEVVEEDFRKTASICEGLKDVIRKYDITASAVKCFPEFWDELRIAPCCALGRIMDEGKMTACEGDMLGALTMLVEYYLADGPALFVDLISMDDESNSGVVWHCGTGPICMAEDPEKVRYGQHSLFSPPAGLTREFACKTGPITCARISERDGNYCVYAMGGEAVEGDASLRGTSMKIKYAQPVEKLRRTLFDDGVENHFAVVYGDIRDQLEDFSKWLGLDSVIL